MATRSHTRKSRIALVGWLAVALSVCAARNTPTHASDHEPDDRIDTVGATHHEWTGPARCRGAKIRALQDAFVTSFDISVKNTHGAAMQFFVYEAYDDSEQYAVVPSATVEKKGTTEDEYDWESSPPLYLQVKAQKYYVLLACWDEAAEAGYRGGPKVAPSDISFGEYLGGSYFDGGTDPPDLFRPATATHDYLVRVHSSAAGPNGRFIPFHDTDPFLGDPTRGRPGVAGQDPAPSEAGQEPAPNNGQEPAPNAPETGPNPSAPSQDGPDTRAKSQPSGQCEITQPVCDEL